MSRRRTRSEADSCGALLFELPDELEHKEESSLLNSDGTAASLKREKELGVYLELRRERGGNDIRVGELRDAFVKWLRPRSVVLHDEPSSTELRGLGGRTVSDLPPAAVNYTMTDGSKKLFVDAVNESIRSSDWHELWVLLGQAEAWTARMHNPSAERPWWMLCHDSVTDWPSELVDIAALEDEGGAGNPLDPEVQPSAKQQRVGVKVKEEAAASTSTAVTKHPLDDFDWEAVSDGKQDEDEGNVMEEDRTAEELQHLRVTDANGKKSLRRYCKGATRHLADWSDDEDGSGGKLEYPADLLRRCSDFRITVADWRQVVGRLFPERNDGCVSIEESEAIEDLVSSFPWDQDAWDQAWQYACEDCLDRNLHWPFVAALSDNRWPSKLDLDKVFPDSFGRCASHFFERFLTTEAWFKRLVAEDGILYHDKVPFIEWLIGNASESGLTTWASSTIPSPPSPSLMITSPSGSVTRMYMSNCNPLLRRLKDQGSRDARKAFLDEVKEFLLKHGVAAQMLDEALNTRYEKVKAEYEAQKTHQKQCNLKTSLPGVPAWVIAAQ